MSSFCYRVTQSVVRSFASWASFRESVSLSLSFIFAVYMYQNLLRTEYTQREEEERNSSSTALLLYTRINDVARQIQMWGATAFANKKETVGGVERKWLIALEHNPKVEK